MSQHTETLVGAAAKLSPSVAVGAATVAGWNLQTWVLSATLFYTVLMIAKLVWDWMVKPNLRKRDP